MTSIVVSGDDLGRVNLLHFIGLFVLWPFISFLLLITFKFIPIFRSLTLIKSLINLPVWTENVNNQLLTLRRDQRLNAWLFLQSQLSVLAFSLGCLLAFLMVLLLSDVAFVWRSTLLASYQLLPFLEFIALPWSMLDIVQPIQSLVNTTQEQRILTINPTNSLINSGAWWQFLLMAQIVYAILPRLLTTLLAFIHFNRLPSFQPSVITTTEPDNRIIVDPVLSAVLTKRPKLEHYNLCCWLALQEDLVRQVIKRFDNSPENIFQVGFHGNDEENALFDKKTQLLLVAAWEPPMGELKDYLVQGRGVVMLIDHKEGVWQPVSSHYINEWRRFCAPLEHWSLYIDEELV